jgi:hypothetical protein
VSLVKQRLTNDAYPIALKDGGAKGTIGTGAAADPCPTTPGPRRLPGSKRLRQSWRPRARAPSSRGRRDRSPGTSRHVLTSCANSIIIRERGHKLRRTSILLSPTSALSLFTVPPHEATPRPQPTRPPPETTPRDHPMRPPTGTDARSSRDWPQDACVCVPMCLGLQLPGNPML